jgi:hypothetical protein
MIIVIDSTGKTADDFTVDFDIPLTLKETKDHHWEVALSSLTYTYSMRNIDSTYNNNVFEYSHNSGSNWSVVTIPGGVYGIDDINAYFQSVMKANGHYTAGTGGADDTYYLKLEANLNTQRVKQVVTSGTYRFRFTTGDFYKLIGSAAGVVSTTTEGPNLPDINRGVTSFNLHTNITKGTYYNGKVGTILYNFLPNTAPGYVIRDEPLKNKFVPLNTDLIRSINFRFTDQQNRTISFFGEAVTIVLEFERKPN